MQNVTIETVETRYNFQLFVSGASPNSLKAIANIKQICEEYMSGNYDLEIIDIYQQPLIAKQHEIIALPLLIKRTPLPVKRLIGDMSDKQKVLKGLGLEN